MAAFAIPAIDSMANQAGSQYRDTIRTTHGELNG